MLPTFQGQSINAELYWNWTNAAEINMHGFMVLLCVGRTFFLLYYFDFILEKTHHYRLCDAVLPFSFKYLAFFELIHVKTIFKKCLWWFPHIFRRFQINFQQKSQFNLSIHFSIHFILSFYLKSIQILFLFFIAKSK